MGMRQLYMSSSRIGFRSFCHLWECLLSTQWKNPVSAQNRFHLAPVAAFHLQRIGKQKLFCSLDSRFFLAVWLEVLSSLSFGTSFQTTLCLPSGWALQMLYAMFPLCWAVYHFGWLRTLKMNTATLSSCSRIFVFILLLNASYYNFSRCMVQTPSQPSDRCNHLSPIIVINYLWSAEEAKNVALQIREPSFFIFIAFLEKGASRFLSLN